MISKITEDFEKVVAVTKSKKNLNDMPKTFYEIIKKEKAQSEIKPIKVGKRPATTYRFGCKYFKHNFRLQEVKMTNKVLRERSNCVVCRSNKSRFLKQKHNNRK